LQPLCTVAVRAADDFARGDSEAFVVSACEYGKALDALGRAADAPIVPPAFAELASLARDEGAAFFPSGAGGGDVAIWLAARPPSAAFVTRALDLSMHPLPLRIDRGGVRPFSPA
jgi:phosphomevalonate kinase